MRIEITWNEINKYISSIFKKSMHADGNIFFSFTWWNKLATVSVIYFLCIKYFLHVIEQNWHFPYCSLPSIKIPGKISIYFHDIPCPSLSL